MKKIASILLAALLLLSTTLPVFAQEDDWDEDSDEQTEETTEVVENLSPEAEALNLVELNPELSGSDALDTLVQDILDEILTEDMNTYDKVLACYDYMVDNTSYGSHMKYMGTAIGDTTCRSIFSQYGEVAGAGAVALTANVGMCNAYASGFILLTRAIGLDSHLVEGSTKASGGGYAYHEWAEIDTDGATYLFDPQLEQNLVRSGLPAYTVFCRTYDQVPGRFHWQNRVD